MAIKIFCDVCQVEIGQTEMSSSFTFLEKNTPFSLEQNGKLRPTQVMENKMILCEKCTKKVRENIKEISKK